MVVKKSTTENEIKPSNRLVTVSESLEMIFHPKDPKLLNNRQWLNSKRRMIMQFINNGDLKKKNMRTRTILIYKDSIDEFLSE